jgi:hypothetical protein
VNAWLEVLKEVGIALGADVAFKKFTERTASEVGNTAGGVVAGRLKDQRATLLNDLRQMPRGDTENLLRRHRESIHHCTENRFVSLLCKVCETPDEGRRPALKYLNDLDEEEFDQMLCLLDHDVFIQWARKLRLHGGRISKKSIEEFKELLERGAVSTRSAGEAAFRKNDEAAAELASIARQFADWLERR